MQNPPVRTADALRFTRLDRVAFNDAVAKGYYPCAPKAPRGTARMFDQHDLEALFIFARSLEQGVLPRIAGPLACSIRERLPSADGEEWLVVVRGIYSGRVVLGSKYNFSRDKDDLGEVFFVEHINLRAIRDRITAEVEHYRSIHTNAGLAWTPGPGADPNDE